MSQKILKGVKSQIDIKLVAKVEGDLGQIEETHFIGTYKKLKLSEAQALEKRVNGVRKANSFEYEVEPINDIELCKELLLDIKQLKWADGSDVEFDDETLTIMLDQREYCDAIAVGAKQALYGIEVALAKN